MLEEITYSQLAKFQLLEEPLQNPPHKCCGCGRYSSGNPSELLHFVDMGFDLEFLGEVYICIEGCFREVMNQLGVLTREQTLRLQEKHDKLIEENKRLTEENKEYKDAVGSITRAIRAGANFSSSVFTTEQSEVSTGSNQKPVRGKERLIKQTDERGSTDVSKHEGDDLLGEI